MDIIFKLRAHREEAVLEQIAEALRQRTDSASREQYPKLWAITDRLTGEQPGPVRKKKWRGVLFLVLGLILLVPGILRPRELVLPLAAGAAAVLVGIWELLPAKKQASDPFRRAAERLMEQQGRIPDNQFEITFSSEAMTIVHLPTKKESRIPYGDFECVVETQNLFLMVYGEQVTVLVKKDLASGSMEALRQLLEEQVRVLKTV